MEILPKMLAKTFQYERTAMGNWTGDVAKSYSLKSSWPTRSCEEGPVYARGRGTYRQRLGSILTARHPQAVRGT